MMEHGGLGRAASEREQGPVVTTFQLVQVALD